MIKTHLLRYNFRIMMLNNWWLMAFPLVISQLTVFWNVLTRRFSPDLPAQSLEMVTPLLAAFLGAHLLSAEYRSRIGAVLASRPVNFGRIVSLRVVVMLVLVWGLAGLSLLAYYQWMEPGNLTPPTPGPYVWMEPGFVTPVVLACIPSTLFMTMLAMTFATLFRHSLAGFGVAALYWAFDLVPGAPLQPYLSLRSLAAYYSVLNTPDRQTFLHQWWIAKIVLLVAALLLYLFHLRLVYTLGSTQTLRLRRRASYGLAGLLVFYLISGAVLKVGYGYTHRGTLPPNDVAWFRYQFAPYGPIPITPLFGSAFTRYLGEITNPWRLPEGEDSDLMGETDRHTRALNEVIEKMPGSIWAPSAAEALARLEAHKHGKNLEETIAYYRHIVERYPQSPYVNFAMLNIAHTYADAGKLEEARTAYSELLQRKPDDLSRSEALRFLVESERKAGHLPEAAKWAEQWTGSAPIQDRFEAWMDLTEIRKAKGDLPGAKQAAQQTMESARQFLQALSEGKVKLTATKALQRQTAAQNAQKAAGALL